MATENTTVCAAVCVASNAAAVIALLLCNSNFIMLQKTKGPSAKKGRMSRLMDVGTRFRRSLMAKQALPTTPFRFRDSIKVAQHIATPPSPPRLVNLGGPSTKSP